MVDSERRTNMGVFDPNTGYMRGFDPDGQLKPPMLNLSLPEVINALKHGEYRMGEGPRVTSRHK